jgi:hypothetical protein
MDFVPVTLDALLKQQVEPEAVFLPEEDLLCPPFPRRMTWYKAAG